MKIKRIQHQQEFIAITTSQPFLVTSKIWVDKLRSFEAVHLNW